MTLHLLTPLAASVCILTTTVLTEGASPHSAAALKDKLKDSPRAELPAVAAAAVSKADAKDKKEVASLVVTAVAETRPAAAAAVVAAVVSAAPETAAISVAEATKVLPGQAQELAWVAAQAAPKPLAIATVAGGASDAYFPGNPPPKTAPENRRETTPGNIKGNRPAIPPGLVRDPKPGNDRKRPYASP